jgi:hypothetical protein
MYSGKIAVPPGGGGIVVKNKIKKINISDVSCYFLAFLKFEKSF